MSKKTKKNAKKEDAPKNEAHVFVEKTLENDDSKTVDAQKKKSLSKKKPVPRDDVDDTSIQQQEKPNRTKKTEDNNSDEMETIDDAKEDFTRQTQKEKEREANMEEQLQEIYKNKDGSLPDMKQFDVRGKHKILKAFTFFFGSVAVLAGLVWYGFFVYQPVGAFSEEDVILSVSGDETVLIGEVLRYRLRYVNSQSVSLNDVKLHIRYPKGFTYVESSSEPMTDTIDTWDLGTLDPQESGYIDLIGTMYGNANEQQSFRAFLSYTPENFSSEFQKVATVTIETKQPDITLDVIGPKQIIAGTPTTLDISVTRPEGQEDRTPLAIDIEPTNVFNKKTSEPKNDQFHMYRWSIASDVKTYDVRVEGTFVPGVEEEVTIPIRLLGWGSEDKQGEPYVLGVYEYTADVVQQDVAITSVVNGAAESLTVQPGDRLNTSVVVRNNADAPLEDVEVRVWYDAPSNDNKSMLDWYELEDLADGIIIGEQQTDAVRRGSITWTSRHIGGLARIDAGQQVTIDLSIPIQDAEDTSLAAYESHDITFFAEVRYKAGDTVQVQSAQPIEMTINSDVSVEVQDEISEPEGNTETHDIIWALKNTYHPLEDIEITAEVYGNTTFDTEALQVPAGDVHYDEANKKLRWTIDEMPLGVDILPLRFRLIRNDLNPSQTQLVSRLQLKARDTVTGEDMIVVGEGIGL